METMIPILTGLAGIVLGFIGFKLFQQSLDAKRRSEAESQILQSTQTAQREAENVVKEAKIEAKDIFISGQIRNRSQRKGKTRGIAGAGAKDLSARGSFRKEG